MECGWGNCLRFLSRSSGCTPTITAPATSFCAGESVVLIASAGTSHKWFNGTTQVGTTATYTTTTAGAYTVEVTNASGCKAISAITTVNGSTRLTPTTATSFCTVGSVVLTASAGNSYKWFNGTTQVGTASTYTASTAGGFTVEVTNTLGCKAISAVTTVNGSTQLTPTPATPFCTFGSVVLTASAGSSYKWFNGTTQVGTAASYTASTACGFTVEVTNALGCKAISAVTTVNGSMQLTPTPATSFCTIESVMLTSSAGTSYKWFIGTTQVGKAASYMANSAGPYTVEVTNALGCKATSAVTQLSMTSMMLWYADADNDGIGDVTNALSACIKPNGYVASAGDECTADSNKTAVGNCGCGNAETSCLDCAGTPNGTAFIDNCSICVGGTTGNTASVTTATINNLSADGVLSTYPQPFTNATTISLKNKIIKSVTFFSLQGIIKEYRHNIHTSEI